MPTKITSLDFRSSDTLIASQESAINLYLTTHTVLDVNSIVVEDEWLYAKVTNVTPASPWKVKIFKGTQSISDNGVTATENAIESFLTGKTLLRLIGLGGGYILVIYI